MITLNEVIKRAKNKDVGETFEIKELFTEQEWENAKNVKAIGKAFYDVVEKKQVRGVERKYIKSNNHSVYIKKP